MNHFPLKPHRCLLIFLFLNLILFVSAQSLCENPDFDIPRASKEGLRINAQVALFNIMSNNYGIKDTISYRAKDGKLQYLYKDNVIENFNYDPKMCGKKLMLSGYHYSHYFRLLASIPLKDDKAQVYEFIRPEKERKRIIFKSYQEKGILPIGDYEERDCQGTVRLKGKYHLVDDDNVYTYQRYDDQLKETVTEEIINNKRSVRKGVWKYFDVNGKALKSMQFPDKKRKNLITKVDLCQSLSDLAQHNYYNNYEKLPISVEVLNTINEIRGIDQRITYDNTVRGYQFYLNGRPIQNPLYKNAGSEDISTKLKKHGDRLLLSSGSSAFLAYIPLGNGHGEIIRFNNKFIEVSRTSDFEKYRDIEKYHCSGELFVKGRYVHKDTLIITSKKSFDPNTYEEIILKDSITTFLSRSGNWKYFDSEGKVFYEENYPGSVRGKDEHTRVLKEALEKSTYAKRRKNPSPNMMFNSLCAQFNLPYWLTEEAVGRDKVYYFMGNRVSDVKVGGVVNTRQETKIEARGMTIKLVTQTNAFGALGTMGKKKWLKYEATIAHENGRTEQLIFNKDDIFKQELLHGQLNGITQRRGFDGKLLEQREYCQMDSIHRDTVSVFNPETYEEQVTITEYNTFPKKCGVWKKFNAQGKLEEEIDYNK